MSDLISRQAAIDALCNDYCGGHQDCKYYPNCENLRSVQKLPSAQPERARGTWMPDTMCYYEERFICSECKGNYKVDTCMGKPMWNFCPNCGAMMKGENSDYLTGYLCALSVVEGMIADMRREVTT